MNKATRMGFARNFLVKDALRSDRPITEIVDEILHLVEQDWHANCQQIAEAHNSLETFEKSGLQKVTGNRGDFLYHLL